MKAVYIVLFALTLSGCTRDKPPQAQSAASTTPNQLAQSDASTTPKLTDATTPKGAATPPKSEQTISLFDGATLNNWKLTDFGGEGEVTVDNGLLILDKGVSLTGVTWKGADLPKTNYEVTLEAKIIDGSDFFCGIGFPVGETNASFVAGGWGGGTCGISMIDGLPAVDNESFSLQDFEKGEWYRFRLRVTPAMIEVWLDDERIVNVDIKEHEVEIHHSMLPSLPFGLATFQTKAAFRNVVLRKLK